MSDLDRNVHNKGQPLTRCRYEVATTLHKAQGLWVEGAGYHRSQKEHLNWRRTLGHYAAVFISRGEGMFESVPSGKIALRAGTLFWLFPTVEHTYSCHINTTWTEQWVIFNGKQAACFEQQGYISPENPSMDVGENTEIPLLFSRIEDVFYTSGPLAIPLAAAFTHELIVIAHGLASGLLGSEVEHRDPVIYRALKMIEREACLGIQPAYLAKRLHVGYSTLRRRFKDVSGYSIKEYILSIQLKKAKELLAFTSESVKSIAIKTGFEDVFYFSRLFKAREGIPPTAFRIAQTR